MRSARDSDAGYAGDAARGSTPKGQQRGSEGHRPITAWEIGESSQSLRLHKLRPFGSASITRPISEGIAQAEADDLFLQAQHERNPL